MPPVLDHAAEVRRLTAAGFTPQQAEVLTTALGEAHARNWGSLGKRARRTRTDAGPPRALDDEPLLGSARRLRRWHGADHGDRRGDTAGVEGVLVTAHELKRLPTF